jgi:DNA-binding CsgD family transcriptional regulator
MATRNRPDIAHNKIAAAPMDMSNGHVGALIREIVASAATSMDSRPQRYDNGTEQIICDTDVDGDRYLLVRMPRPPAHAPLSPRELEIVRMIAQGHSNKIIADVLSISSWTVCTHVRRIFAKMGVGSRAAMVARSAECGALSERPRPRDQANLGRNRMTEASPDRSVCNALPNPPVQVGAAASINSASRLMRRTRVASQP